MRLLEKLTQTVGVSGSEDAVFKIIKQEINPDVDDIHTDAAGNFIAHKNGDGKKILICAHADEVGLVITKINDNGTLCFSPLGRVEPIVCLNHRVIFQNGLYGSVIENSEIKSLDDINTDNMYIDIGASSYNEASEAVKPGDACAVYGKFTVQRTTVTSKALDNRIGTYVMIEAIKKISDSKQDLYFAFTSQSELCNKNAMCAAYNINPDIIICIDVTTSNDISGSKKGSVKLGGGPAIKIMDKSVITHSGLRNAIVRCAKEHNISYQFEVMSSGGTDAGSMQTLKGGFAAAVVSVPLRYVHTPCETADKRDIEACIELITEFCKKDFIFV